jgi:hypothetical protein
MPPARLCDSALDKSTRAAYRPSSTFPENRFVGTDDSREGTPRAWGGSRSPGRRCSPKATSSRQVRGRPDGRRGGRTARATSGWCPAGDDEGKPWFFWRASGGVVDNFEASSLILRLRGTGLGKRGSGDDPAKQEQARPSAAAGDLDGAPGPGPGEPTVFTGSAARAISGPEAGPPGAACCGGRRAAAGTARGRATGPPRLSSPARSCSDGLTLRPRFPEEQHGGCPAGRRRARGMAVGARGPATLAKHQGGFHGDAR